MKNMTLASLLFFSIFQSAVAFAAPKVGDQAVMEGTLVGGGVTEKVTTKQTIIAFAANTGVYTVRQMQSLGENSQTKDETVLEGDLMSEETAAQIVEACESAGIGMREVIRVKAGKFTACKLKSDSESVLWIAAVPFGVVRLQTPSATGSVDVSLHSFTH